MPRQLERSFMSPEDRDEQDRLRWQHYDRMVWGDPDAFDKHRDDELTRDLREIEEG
jgi:hypothetical protein